MKRRQFITGLAAAVTMTPTVTRAAPRWQTGRPLPVKIQEIYPAVHDGGLYVAGGIAARLGIPYFTDGCFRYSPSEDRWTKASTLPEARHHAALVSARGRLFLAGGFNGGYTHVWRMRNTVHELTPEGWEARGALPKPQAEGVLAARGNGSVHLVTGQSPKGEANKARRDHAEITDHWVWDLDGNWETAAPIPTPRNSGTGGWIGDQLVVAGGRTRKGNLDTTEIYDGREDRWRKAAPMPLPQAGTASVVIGEDLIVFGGEIFKPESRVFPNVWRYSMEADRWTSLPDLPTPRHGLGAGLIDGRIYVVGGATAPGGRGTSNANEILTL